MGVRTIRDPYHVFWIPAFAGMTEEADISHSGESRNPEHFVQDPFPCGLRDDSTQSERLGNA